MGIVYASLSLAFGIWFADAQSSVLGGTWLLLLIASPVLWWRWRFRPGWRVGAAVLCFFLIGATRLSLVPETGSISAFTTGTGATVEGVLVEAPDIRDDRVQFVLAVDKLDLGAMQYVVDGRVLVRAPSDVVVRYGDRVSATGQLIEPGEIDQFDYAAFLSRRGIYGVLSNVAAVEVISSNHGNAWYAALIDFRVGLKGQVNRHLPEPYAGLLIGMLLGDERGISPDVTDAFRVSGTAHLLAVSGYNVALVIGVVSALIMPLRLPRLPRFVALMIAVVGFTLLAGAGASVVRAAVMASVVAFGQMLNRRAYLPASLAATVIVLTLLDPGILWDVGFQLSLVATLGIAVFLEPMQRRLAWLLKPEFPHSLPVSGLALLTNGLLVTLSATLLVVPLSGWVFGQVSLVGLAVNALIGPAQAALLVTGAGALVAALWFPGLAQTAFWATLIPLGITADLSRWAAELPLASTALNVRAEVPLIAVLLTVGGSALAATRPTWSDWLMFWLRQRRVWATACAGAVGVLLLMIALLNARPDGLLHVWFLDVGHSQTVLIQTPDGMQILLNGGRYPARLLTDIGDRLPFNDLNLDVIFVSAPDPAEIVALRAVLARYEVSALVTNGQPNFGAAWEDMMQAANGIPIISVTRGYALEGSDGVVIEVQHPPRTPDLQDRLEDYPLVLRLVYGDHSFMLTSGLGTSGQADLIESGGWPSATVLQLPRHASARSLSPLFLEAAEPQILVIQADRTNLRGDPDSDVLAILPPDIPLYRTDKHGTLHFISDGQTLTIQTEKTP